MVRRVLLPKAVGLVPDRFTEVDGLVVVEARGVVRELRCPDCPALSLRVHSRYLRRLAELPVGGRGIVVKLTVRRFFCDTADCPRRTFAEQVEGLTVPGPG